MGANCDLLIHNGFVFADNQTDCLTVRLGVAKTDTLASQRLGLLERVGVNSHKFYLRRTEEPLDRKLVAFLRVLQMEQDQAVLKDSKDSVTQLCCQLRMAEKRILVSTVAYC